MDDLVQGIRNICDETEKAQLVVVGNLVPLNIDSILEQTAVVYFLPQPPKFMQNILEDRAGVREEQIVISSPGIEKSILSIDRHFFGLTQLYQPANGEISMDIIAITGLDGNAFGSWKSRQAELMWLRDFLQEDLPSCRVMTYGYNLKLASNMLHTLEDLCAQFLQAIKVARASEEARYRPLVLIGHSYGTRIITKSLVRCKIMDHDPVLKALLSATQAVVFFGGPHRGMFTDDIEKYLAERFPEYSSRQNIVTELRRGDDGAKRELQDFIDLVGSFFIISIYERKKSRTLVPQEGEEQVRKWSRIGQEYVPVGDDSAVLNLPSHLEVRIPSDSDHSNMVKFDHRDPVYRELLWYLKEIEQTSSSTAYPWMNLLNSGTRRLLSYGKTTNAEQDIASRKALIDVAIETVRSWRASRSHTLAPNLPDDRTLLPGIESALIGARSYILLLQSSKWRRETGVRAIVMEYSEALNTLLALLDFSRINATSFVSHAGKPLLRGKELSKILKRIDWLNQQLGETLSSVTSQFYHHLGPGPTLEDEAPRKIAAVASMAIMQLELDDSSFQEPQWVPHTDLYFQTSAVSEIDREGKNWLEKLVENFTQSKSQDLKLQPRRFGALDHNHQLRKVMVEFRPYLPELWDTQPAAYDRERWQVLKLGRMLRAETDRNVVASFPCVPLIFLSECRTSLPPAFVLIYDAENLYSLDEALTHSPVPPPEQRLRLGLGLAKSIAALHLAGIVHGGINTENIYLRYDPSDHERGGPLNLSIDKASPLLAGFDIARDFLGGSSKLDVEDPELRVYLHPERMEWGDKKEMQHHIYDVFSLGMVMIEIGLWQRFKSFQKYHDAYTDEERKEFSMRLRGYFKGNDSEGRMDARYRAAISYCLGQRADPVVADADLETGGFHTAATFPLGRPNAVRVVQALTQILGEKGIMSLLFVIFSLSSLRTFSNRSTETAWRTTGNALNPKATLRIELLKRPARTASPRELEINIRLKVCMIALVHGGPNDRTPHLETPMEPKGAYEKHLDQRLCYIYEDSKLKKEEERVGGNM